MPSVERSSLICEHCRQPLQLLKDPEWDRYKAFIPGMVFHACLNRACPEYEFADIREVLGRPKARRCSVEGCIHVPEHTALCWLHTPGQFVRTRKRRALKPGEARIRYNDGSHYSLSRVMDVTHGPQGVRVTQALPMRATVTGYVEHLIPAHNVDVVSVRRHGLPEDLIDHHEHCAWCGEHHASAGCAAAPWYVRAWDWLWHERRWTAAEIRQAAKMAHDLARS